MLVAFSLFQEQALLEAQTQYESWSGNFNKQFLASMQIQLLHRGESWIVQNAITYVWQLLQLQHEGLYLIYNLRFPLACFDLK